MATLRTPETEARYAADIARGGLDECPLCKRESVHEFTFWRIVSNLYPYDRFAKTHDMLVLRRHAGDSALTDEERGELAEIKYGYVQEHYNFMIEPVRRKKSIPEHSHLHLVIEKD